MLGPTDPSGSALAGQHILAVEDDFLVLLEVATVLASAGASVVKCTSIEQALQAIDREALTAAVLDMRVGRETIAPVARKLTERRTPFLFYTGQMLSEAAQAQWPDVRIVSKPALAPVLINAMAGLLLSSKEALRPPLSR